MSNEEIAKNVTQFHAYNLFCFSPPDDFYHYELDDLPGWEIQPHLRLLNKRQVSGTAEEPKKEKEVNEKKLLFKDKPSNQTDTPENSSNKSIPVTSSTLLGDASMLPCFY